MKTAILTGSFLFQCVLFLVVLFSFLLKSGSYTGFDYIPWEFYFMVGIPSLTYLSLQAFYFTGHLNPKWKKISKVIALVFVAVCIVLLLYGFFAVMFNGAELAVILLMAGLCCSAVFSLLHVLQR